MFYGAATNPTMQSDFASWLRSEQRGRDYTTVPPAAATTPRMDTARAAGPALFPRTVGQSGVGLPTYAEIMNNGGGAGPGGVQRAIRRRAAKGTGDARWLLRGVLPPPSYLIDFGADAAPTPAEVSNAPELLGEQGTRDPMDERRMADLEAVQAQTSAAAVSPNEMGVTNNPMYHPASWGVATAHAPDLGVEAAGAERGKQLPSRTAFVQAEAMLEQAGNRSKILATQGPFPPTGEGNLAVLYRKGPQ